MTSQSIRPRIGLNLKSKSLRRHRVAFSVRQEVRMVTVQVFECDRRPRTISAIKYIRDLRGMGLGESKGLIDEVSYHRRPVALGFVDDADAQLFVEKMEAFGFRCRCLTTDRDQI